MTVHLIETFHNVMLGDVETWWHVEPPDKGVSFRVTRQEWTDDYTVRHIYEIKRIVTPEPHHSDDKAPRTAEPPTYIHRQRAKRKSQIPAGNLRGAL